MVKEIRKFKLSWHVYNKWAIGYISYTNHVEGNMAFLSVLCFWNSDSSLLAAACLVGVDLRLYLAIPPSSCSQLKDATVYVLLFSIPLHILSCSWVSSRLRQWFLSLLCLCQQNSLWPFPSSYQNIVSNLPYWWNAQGPYYLGYEGDGMRPIDDHEI